MILLQVQQVMRRFGADVLFDNVQMDIQEHARVALVGRNGAGKSTLLKMIAGETVPDEGQISMRKGLTIGYLAQDQGLDSHNTIWEEMSSVFAELHAIENRMHQLENQLSDPTIMNDEQAYQQTLKTYDQIQTEFQQKNGYGYQAEIRGVLHGFQFDADVYDKSVTELSGGQKTQLALAKLLLEKRDLLILDEPTNHLDVETLTWLESYLQSYAGALLIVSHDRYFLDRVVNEVYDLSHHEMVHYTGNYDQFVQEKAARIQAQWKHYEKQQAEISKLEDFVNRNIVRASTTKRAQARRKQLAKMDRLDRPDNDEKTAHFGFHAAKQSGNIVLTVKDAAVGYDGRILSEPDNLSVKKHEAIAIVGPNGIGKSTFLKSILGQIPFIKGQAVFGTGVVTGYYDQEQRNLNDKKTVLGELWDEHPTTPEKDIRTILGSFLFTGEDVDKPVHALSGGERARLLLTKLAMQNDNFLILDEPTNHLDIDSREVLEVALNDFDGTLLFVSHDRYFINQVATSVVEVSPEGTELFLGDYDYYIDKKQEQAEIAAAAASQAAEEATSAGATDPTSAATATPRSTGQQNYQASKQQQREKRKLERTVAALEEQMTTLDTQATQIQTKMAQPEISADVGQLQDLQKELDAITIQQEQVETEWTEQAEALEELN
ncbi:ABC-F family ATP-binding cassette domain-containing protein [Lactiplantibacillus paraplantarum]|uniref:ABC-F family ATP-binding cassette domain-containing protein n=1 Tax=Lactiplantibacillus paraplantarum TaxID=60520 RepID=UPI00051349F0|nr:ABC-F family ATP-binding cassette domain-containing protein [Lactiplantibacillus paraplantarum]OAX76774.1 multidrug ABC transporter ATP-binding protein [Lactiplantibacillus plantarum]ALO03639.1 multidrug ABC transporter ATP-binding protein [Lactiplantibacillus paraplantarum]KGE75305.1 multidrug ABC transporter ATP-binding protein [Lactiplantibacillus paraplantarum]MCW1909393.1 ABC-F family ATP-binding cassette domain-containing protein [Lactiplantibacillus paraplantarum]RDG13775.1 ABC trans